MVESELPGRIKPLVTVHSLTSNSPYCGGLSTFTDAGAGAKAEVRLTLPARLNDLCLIPTLVVLVLVVYN
jgi:hypothetical protein